MKTVTGKQLASALERHGWTLLRIHGSHHYYAKSGVDVKLSVPIHGNRPLKPGLLHRLMKDAGLSEDDL